MTLFSFTGWELVGFALWACLLVAAWWALDRKPSLSAKDRAWARRHRI